MQTQSHAIINAALGTALEKRGIRPGYWALVLGSLMPDLPLTVLTFIYLARNNLFGQPPDVMFGPAYDALYFTDPVWITSHSLMHSPPMIALWLALGWVLGFRYNHRWGQFLFWFAVGNALHTALDIPTHHNDGPLLLYPFNWTLRFNSPISYWHPDYYGRQFAVFETILNIILTIYFIVRGVRLWQVAPRQ